jgi:hypothetical protein
MRFRSLCASLVLLLLLVGGVFFYPKKVIYDGPRLFLGLGLTVGDITEQVNNARKIINPDPTIYSIDYFWDELFPDQITRFVLRKNGLLNIRWSPVLSDSFDPFALQDISEGIWDDHIRSWAVKAKEYEYPLLFSFAANFNDKSSGGFVVRDVEAQKDEYIEAYRHVVNLFKDEGAHNVMWVWSVSLTDSSLSSLELMELYPTGNIIDWVGASGDVNKNNDILERLELFRSPFREEIKKKPFILELKYSELKLKDAQSLKRIVDGLDPKISGIEALIFNVSGSLQGSAMKDVLKAPYFGRSRDDIQLALKK